jgi:hypothetical protein
MIYLGLKLYRFSFFAIAMSLLASLGHAKQPSLDHDIEQLKERLSMLISEGLEFDEQTTGQYVRFADVKHWELAPPHHAMGYDENNELIAIFDLTYQNTRSLEFIGRSILGTIGIVDLNLREIIELTKFNKNMEMRIHC